MMNEHFIKRVIKTLLEVQETQSTSPHLFSPRSPHRPRKSSLFTSVRPRSEVVPKGDGTSKLKPVRRANRKPGS